MPEGALTCWDKLEPGRVSSPCRGRWRRAQRADGGGVSAETLHVVTHDRRVGVTPLPLAALGYSPLEGRDASCVLPAPWPSPALLNVTRTGSVTDQGD